MLVYCICQGKSNPGTQKAKTPEIIVVFVEYGGKVWKTKRKTKT